MDGDERVAGRAVWPAQPEAAGIPPQAIHAKNQGVIVGVIPARFASTRLPGKPLLSETGKPLIQHVVEAASRSTRLDRVIVATDDDRIVTAVRQFGGEVVLTRSDHPSGTDRVAEVAMGLPHARIVVNIQGDEPEVSGETIDRLVELLEHDREAGMATLATRIKNSDVYRDPSCVKVVVTTTQRALYFSRAPIPYDRDHESELPRAWLHLGIYAYRRDFLLNLASLPPSDLERYERLEQLRVLEAGYPIAVGCVDEPAIGIDTPEDYRRFVDRWKARLTAA